MVDEINALESVVDEPLWHALHAVRETGNIGAHPERDPTVIVDVEPGEATAMIDLLEIIINETYIVRANRAKALERSKKILDAKNEAKGRSAP